jgi:hypothetical protein
MKTILHSLTSPPDKSVDACQYVGLDSILLYQIWWGSAHSIGDIRDRSSQ